MNNLKKHSFGLFFLFIAGISLYGSNPDIELIKERVLKEIMYPYSDDARIERLNTSIKKDGTWPDINYIDVSNEGFENRIHLSNMLNLAQAYNSKSSAFYKNEKAKKTIEVALKHWVEKDYICENWWHNQIGTPGSLVELLLLVGNELPGQLVEKTQVIIGRANIDAPGARPGGDRIKIASIEAKNMLFLGNEKRFEMLVKVIESEIHFVEWIGMKYGYSFRNDLSGFNNRSSGGRGIQYDYSFHHRTDGVNNTLSYGLGYADAFIEWAVFLTGTKYSFSEEKIDQLIDYYLDGICKTAIYGKYPDPGAKNRSISREGSLGKYSSASVKGLLMTSDYRKDELEEIDEIRSKNIRPVLSHATFYWNSEHFTFQRPEFFTSVRLYSTRNYNMEQPYNGEGLLNHYRGDGVNHISVSGKEYYHIWPVYDYRKIPGATILQDEGMPPPKEIQKLGLTDFVGAVTDGKFGAVGFDFKSPHDPLCARKSWFFFDKEYVCLGADISCKRDASVATTINQCLLVDDVTVSRNKSKTVIEKGEEQFEQVEWVFHDGIAYIFPQPTSVNIMNSEANGSWWRINKQSDSPKDEITLDVFKLWIDHGKRPSDASYEYIVSPATTIQQLEKDNPLEYIKIISNSPYIQAVRNEKLNICQVVFYKSGTIQVSDELQLTSYSPGIFLIKFNGNRVNEISASDPNRELEKIYVSINQKIDKNSAQFSSVWNEHKMETEISIELPQGVYAGKSVTIKL